MGANQSREATKFTFENDSIADYISSRESVRINGDPHSSESDEIGVDTSDKNRWNSGLARNNLSQSNTPAKLFSKNKSFNPKLKSYLEAKLDKNKQILNRDNQDNQNIEKLNNEYSFLDHLLF